MKKTARSKAGEGELPALIPKVPKPTGIKQPGSQLGRLLKLANLIPSDWLTPNYDPSELLEIVLGSRFFPGDQINHELPTELRLHLLELINRPAEWPYQPEDIQKHYEAQFAKHSRKNGRPIKPAAHLFNHESAVKEAQLRAVLERYRFILRVRENLRNIARGRYNEMTFAGKLIRKEVGNGKKRYLADAEIVDPFYQAIQGEEVFEYIRECQKLKCGRLFFAKHQNQRGCTTEHSAAIYKRNQRTDHTHRHTQKP